MEVLMSLPGKTPESRLAAPLKPYAPPRLVSYGSVKDIVQGGGGTKSDGPGHPSTKSCWVAEALYGVDAPRTTLLRAWVTRQHIEKGRWRLFAALYSRHGRAAADAIHLGRVPRHWVRPFFDFLVDTAFDESARAIKASGHSAKYEVQIT
jgi:hypothetical protein